MALARTHRPASSEMRRIGRLFESLVNFRPASPRSGNASRIGSPRRMSEVAKPPGSEGAETSRQVRRIAAAGERKAANSPFSGVSDEAWRALAPHVKHVVRDLEAFQLQSCALTALVEDEKEICAAVLLPSGKGTPPRLLVASGGMRALLGLDGDGGHSDAALEGFLERCQQAHERTEERIQWRASNGADCWLSTVTTARLPGCEIVLVHLACIGTDDDTIAACRRNARARGLTRRQVEVLELLACGLGNREIARLLEISYHTARAHLRDIFAKLSVSNRVEAINAVRARPRNSAPRDTPKRPGSSNG